MSRRIERSARRARFAPRLRWFVLATWALGLTAGAAAAAPPVNADPDGVAIKGYDVVAYHVEGRAARGSERWEHRWRGAIWRFSSERHRALFVEAPERYAPRYGGYCAWAMARGKKVGVDPEAWSVVEGRLYLNYSIKIRGKWEAERDSRIERADAHWRRIEDAAR